MSLSKVAACCGVISYNWIYYSGFSYYGIGFPKRIFLISYYLDDSGKSIFLILFINIYLMSAGITRSN